MNEFAESVETREQVEFLELVECGGDAKIYFSKPLPTNSFMRFKDVKKRVFKKTIHVVERLVPA